MEWQERLSIVASLTTGQSPSTLGAAIPPQLHDADPGDILELIHALFPLCGERPLTTSTSIWWQRRPVRLASTLAAATGLLDDWPDAITNRLASVGGRRAAEVTGANAILEGRNMRPGGPAAALLANLAEAMRTHGSGRGPGSDAAYSIGTASRLLGSGTAIVAAKRRGNLLRTSPMLRHGEVVLGLDRTDVDSVVDQLTHRLSLWKVASRLGTPRYAVEDLVHQGMLVTSSHPYMVDRYGPDAFDSRNVDDFVRSLEGRSTSDVGDGIPLRTMMQSIGGRLKPWATVSEAIASGTAPVRVDGGSRPLVDRVHVCQKDVGRLLATGPKTCVDANTGRPINRGDAIEVLNLNAKHYRALAAATNDREVVPAWEILSFAQAFISPTEITARWGTDGRTATALIRRVMPKTERHLFGWPRGVVEALAVEMIAAGRH